MTGKIRTLSAERSAGVIEAENGLRFPFESRSVLAYDVAFLATGHLVTFDLEDGASPKAINVCLQRSRSAPAAESKHKEITLRYVGFDQVKSIRTYRFERGSRGEQTEMFAVNTDVCLFTKYHLGIQEGPALCLRLLMLGFESPDPSGAAPQSEQSLTEPYIVSYLASKPVPGARPHKRIPRPAASSAQ
jgi:hypothetical protein